MYLICHRILLIGTVVKSTVDGSMMSLLSRNRFYSVSQAGSERALASMNEAEQ